MEILTIHVNAPMDTKVPTVKYVITVITRIAVGGARVRMVHMITHVTVVLAS
jgi:hypothetical protein